MQHLEADKPKYRNCSEIGMYFWDIDTYCIAWCKLLMQAESYDTLVVYEWVRAIKN